MVAKLREGWVLISASVAWEDGSAKVRAGPFEFIVQSALVGEGDHPTVDYAVYGLAMLSMSARLAISIEQPVSTDTAARITRIARAFELFDLPYLGRLDLTFSQLVPPVTLTGRQKGIVCVSGGIDSAHAALRAKAEHGFTHGLLIAGADYPYQGSAGFDELETRVRRICGIVGLELAIVRTSVREVPCLWEMMHGLNLAMCLNCLAPRFELGGFALDYSGIEDLYRHPWGNSRPLASLLSRPSFPILTFGSDEGRIEKLEEIMRRAPAIADHLSVCWVDISTGNNCGRCHKCTITRLALHSCGIDDTVAFPKEPPLAELIAGWSFPDSTPLQQVMRLRALELLWNLPADSPYRPLIADYDKRLNEWLKQAAR